MAAPNPHDPVTPHQTATIIQGRFRRRSTHDPDERPETIFGKYYAADLALPIPMFFTKLAVAELAYAKVRGITSATVRERLHGRLSLREITEAGKALADRGEIVRTRERANDPWQLSMPNGYGKADGWRGLSCSLLRSHTLTQVFKAAIASGITEPDAMQVTEQTPVTVAAVRTVLRCTRQAVYKDLRGTCWEPRGCQLSPSTTSTLTEGDRQPTPRPGVNSHRAPNREPSALTTDEQTDEVQTGASAPKPVGRDSDQDKHELPNRTRLWIEKRRPELVDKLLALVVDGDPDRQETRRRVACCVQAVSDNGIRLPMAVARNMIRDAEEPRPEHCETARSILRPDPVPHHCPRCGHTETLDPDRTHTCDACCSWHRPWVTDSFGVPESHTHRNMVPTAPGDVVAVHTEGEWREVLWGRLTPEQQAGAEAAMAERRARTARFRELCEEHGPAEASRILWAEQKEQQRPEPEPTTAPAPRTPKRGGLVAVADLAREFEQRVRAAQQTAPAEEATR